MDPMTMMALMSLLGAGASGLGAASSGGGMFGTPGSFDQISNLTPEQQKMISQLMPQLQQGQGLGMDWITDMLSNDPEAMAKFEAPYKRQFEQETVPGIAERFAGMGTGGSQSSSAMNQSMGQAGRELSEKLAALKGNLQQSAMGSLQGMMGMGMQPQFENVYNQPKTGFLGGLAGGLGQGAGQMAGMAGLKSLGIG
jgi:hypothetical protein